MNGTPPPDGSQQSPSSRSSALLWTVAVVGVLGGVGLYLSRGDGPAAEPEAAPAAASAPIAAAPDPTPTPPPPPNYHTVPACRLFDGNVAAGDSVLELNPGCALPATAKTLAVVLSVIYPDHAGSVGLRAADAAGDQEPAAGGAAPLEFQAGRPRNGTVYVPLPADGSARVGVRNTAAAPVRILLDLSGYFE